MYLLQQNELNQEQTMDINQHKLRESIRRLTANIESHHTNPNKQIQVAIWRAARDTKRIQLRKINETITSTSNSATNS